LAFLHSPVIVHFGYRNLPSSAIENKGGRESAGRQKPPAMVDFGQYGFSGTVSA
jgi:hypothetical protein